MLFSLLERCVIGLGFGCDCSELEADVMGFARGYEFALRLPEERTLLSELLDFEVACAVDEIA